MKIAVFPEHSSIAGRPVFQAFIDSLGDEGVGPSMDGDAAVIWSLLWSGRMKGNQQIWNHYRSQNKPVIVLEVGNIRRNVTWKVGINGINNDAIWPMADGERRLDLVTKPWRESTPSDAVVICGQHGASEQWKDMPSVSDWMIEMCKTVRSHSSRKIILRPHPRFDVIPDQTRKMSNVLIMKPRHVEGSYDDFDFNKCLTTAHAVVCHSSGPAVTSILNGVPAFVSSHSLAHPVGNDINDLSKIENPLLPDREQWADNISYTEWTLKEISQGVPWRRLRDQVKSLSITQY